MKLSSYRNRFKLRGVIRYAVIALGVLFILGLMTFMYLQRFIVYTIDGAVLDFEQTMLSAEPWTPPEPLGHEPEIIYDEPVEEVEVAVPTDDGGLAELKQLNGVYVTYTELENIETLKQRLEGLTYTSIVLEVKRDKGRINYPSSLTETRGYLEGNTEAVGDFIKDQVSKGKYVIARISCFRDELFALDNHSDGLPISGGALWLDSDAYYWVNPGSEKGQSYIVSIGKELRDLGVSELLLAYFGFPTQGNTGAIVYSGSQSYTDVITAAAENVAGQLSEYGMRVSLLAGSSTCISGTSTAAGHDMSVLTGIFDRIYVELSAGSEIGSVADGLIMASNGKILMKSWLVFITDSNDTRFSSYGLIKK